MFGGEESVHLTEEGKEGPKQAGSHPPVRAHLEPVTGHCLETRSLQMRSYWRRGTYIQ